MTINEQINELGEQVQAQLLSETNLREEMKDVISRLEQEERARVRNTNEFDHKQVLQQSRCDDLAAKVETLEALFSLHQQERDVSEHHSSDVDYRLLAKHLEDFQLLEHQVQEIKNNKIEQCMHHQFGGRCDETYYRKCCHRLHYPDCCHMLRDNLRDRPRFQCCCLFLYNPCFSGDQTTSNPNQFS